MRICLITPGHLSTNPRLVKEADALTAAGHAVTVVAASYLPWAREADETFAARPWRRTRPVTFGPHAPAGLRAVQAGRRLIARALFRGGLGGRAALRMASHPAASDLACRARRIEADLYIAHYIAALPAAALAAGRWNAPYAFDAEDFHPGEFASDGPRQLDGVLTSAIERLYLPTAAYVSAASPGIADAYAAAYGIARPTVILNVFPRGDAPATATPKGLSPIGPSVYWFSQTIGRDRGLETAVRAIARAVSRPHLFLRGTLAADYRAALFELAGREGVAERLHILPPAPPRDMIRLAGQFDVGLVGETGHTCNRRIALTNKQFTYLLAGVPALMSDIEAHRRIAAEASAGCMLFTVEDPQSLAEAMDALLADPSRLAAARAAAFSLGRDRFNWDREQAVFLECVTATAQGRRVS